CQWQHVAPPAQRDAKAAIVAEQLARTAGVRDAEVLPTLTTGGDWHYRARLTLVVEGRRAGYHRARSHRLLEIEDRPIADPAADAFTQVNPAANRLLVASVVALGAFAPGERVLDLYSGAGNFALPVARRGARVRGVERDPVAAAAGRENAGRLGLDDATFETAPVADAVGRMVPGTADAVILDPPRAGAADAI